MEVYHLGSWDYAVIALFLTASLCIGLVFSSRKRQKTSGDFMLAGRDMSMLPVVLSLVVSHLSAITMIGQPAEMYRYGAQPMVCAAGVVAGMILASRLMLPIYFRLGISSIYEYLEMRYGRYVRLTASGLFLIQMILFMSVVLKAPALALSATTDLSMETSIVLMGVVCIVYCALGGLKAVLWTDTLQSVLMFAFLIIIVVVGTREAGGPAEVILKAKEGGRWIFFDFTIDLSTRYTVWNCIIQGLSFGISAFGMSQLEIQRLLSTNSIKRAQTALYLSIVPGLVILSMSQSLGLILYAVFNGCDPVLDKERTGLQRHDQLVPYYIVTRLSRTPGLTGLCIAGLFGGSLSTISSAVNSIATVTVVDFVKPSCARLTDTALLWTAKCLILVYGSAVIGLAFALAHTGTLAQMATASITTIEGPIVAVFLLGVLTTRNTQKGSIVGFFAGAAVSGWVGYGSILSGYVYPPLHLSTEQCHGSPDLSMTFNSTNLQPGSPPSDIFFVHRISHMWIATLGFIVTTFTSYIISTITGSHREKKVDSKFLSPFVKLWMDVPPDVDPEADVGDRSRMLTDAPKAFIRARNPSPT